MKFYAIILFATATMMVEGNENDIVIVFDNPYEATFGNYSFGINETIGYENYILVLNQTISATQNQKVGPNDTLFGFYKPYGCFHYYIKLGKNIFSYTPETQADILFTNKTNYYSKIESTLINYHTNEGPKPIDKIASMMQNTMIDIFGEKENRGDAVDSMVVIVFKDRNDDPSTTQALAERLGIHVYAIGIGNVATSYLEKVSGSSDRVIKIDNFDLLGNTLNSLFTNITTSVHSVTTVPISPIFKCNGSLDVVFVFDTFSSSLVDDHTVYALIDLIYAMQWGTNETNAGIVAFCGVNPVYLNLQSVLQRGVTRRDKAYNEIYKCSGTFDDSVVIENYENQTVIGMQKALDMFATSENRINASDIMVVATDKVPPNLPMLTEMIARAAANNVKVYTIGIGTAAYDSLVSVNGAQRTFYCTDHLFLEYNFMKLCN